MFDSSGLSGPACVVGDVVDADGDFLDRRGGRRQRLGLPFRFGGDRARYRVQRVDAGVQRRRVLAHLGEHGAQAEQAPEQAGDCRDDRQQRDGDEGQQTLFEGHRISEGTDRVFPDANSAVAGGSRRRSIRH